MTPGELIDRACAAFGINAFAQGLQLVAARDLNLANARPPAEYGSSAEVTSSPVAPWVEQQGIGKYAASLEPYPLVPTRPALVWQFEQATSIANVINGLLMRYPQATW